MMLTDKEQHDLLDDPGPTTEKINKKLSEAEDRILKQLAPIQQKVDEHDNAFVEIAKGLSKGFGTILSITGKVTGKVDGKKT
jgi:hypothetical protein